jgi:hypothetical protein
MYCILHICIKVRQAVAFEQARSRDGSKEAHTGHGSRPERKVKYCIMIFLKYGGLTSLLFVYLLHFTHVIIYEIFLLRGTNVSGNNVVEMSSFNDKMKFCNSVMIWKKYS